MTAADLPAHLAGKVEVTPDAPQDVMRDLSARGWHRVYVDGGRIVQAFLNAALVTDMAIFRMPVLLGAGRPLFGEFSSDIRLETLGAVVLPTGAVRTDYRVLAAPR
jgi:dihydrofolate reductase